MTKIFAHRGASNYAPENTMAAFELAVSQGAEGIETDVHLTKDNIPVIIHDEKIDRTTNNTGLVKDYTYDEIRQLDAGSWMSKSFSKETIISLEEFLKWIKDKDLLMNVELKNNKINYPHIEAIVYEQIKYHKLSDRAIMSTFNKQSIKRCKTLDSSIEVAWLTSKRNRNLISDFKKTGADAIHMHYRLLNKKDINKANYERIPIRVYTINKRRQLRKCYSLQCAAIFSDIPDFSKLVREQTLLN